MRYSWHSFFINKLLFVKQRDQYVVCKSDVLPVDVAFPVGSVFGPLLFNIFVNDISQLVMKNVLFADDAVFYKETVNFHELIENIQGFVSIMSDCVA